MMSGLLRRVTWAVVLVAAMAATGTAQDRARHGRLFPPEDLGDLEGPDRDAWQMPDAVMDAMGIADGSAVADIGAGGGWFTVRLARRVGPNGIIYAEDVQPQMVEAIRRRVDREGLHNVRTLKGDPADPRLAPDSVDAVLIVESTQEFADAVELLRRLVAALKPGGRLGIINSRVEGGGPGPRPEERVDERRVIREAESAGLRLLRQETFLPFQYFLIFGTANSGAPAETRQAPQGGEHRGSETQLDQVGHDKRVRPRPQGPREP
jgi:ubiquinone/menaquinone biosynthesis C-methylase UbiE